MEGPAGEATVAGGFDIAMRHGNLCTERLESLQVKVDRAGTPGATAGERDAATAEACHERSENVETCAHRLHEFVRGLQVVGSARVNLQHMGFATDMATDDAQHVGHGLHVLEVRDVRDFGYAVGKKCCGHYGEHCILCPGNFNFAV